MSSPVFGNENAEGDELLYDCSLDRLPRENTIVTGKWGTGKTAALYLACEALSKQLASQDPETAKLWYLSESDIDVHTLLVYRDEHPAESQSLMIALERVWTGEIVRAAALLLSQLWHFYGEPKAAHWDFIICMGRIPNTRRSLWSVLNKAMKVILGPEREKSIDNLRDEVSMCLSRHALTCVQRCIRDVPGHALQPVVAAEPIETPRSNLEDHSGLAQMVVTSLLNAYQRSFEPLADQPLQVRIAIPWHRFDPRAVNFAHKLRQYMVFLKWTRGHLREFICRRIAWEFKRVQRSQSSGDLWNALFDKEVRNDHCEGSIVEESFNFVLRHTHWRARDVQRIARLAVQGRANNRSTDDVLAGRGGIKVDHGTIRAAVAEACRDMAEDLITEGARRFEGLRSLIYNLTGMPVPFGPDKLKDRISKIPGEDYNDAIANLWSAGILGVQIKSGPDTREEIGEHLPQDVLRMYEVAGRKLYVWSLFEHTWEGAVGTLMNRYGQRGDGGAEFIIHPVLFDKLLCRVTREHPIGA